MVVNPPIADIDFPPQSVLMTKDEMEAATVASGLWRYADEVDKPVSIVALPFDYWYAIGEADDQLDEGEEPEPMGENGLIYYPSFTGIDGPGFPTLIQAKGFAQSKVAAEIRWR